MKMIVFKLVTLVLCAGLSATIFIACGNNGVSQGELDKLIAENNELKARLTSEAESTEINDDLEVDIPSFFDMQENYGDQYQQYIIDQKLQDFWNVDIPDDVQDDSQRQLLLEYIEHYLFNTDLIGHIMIPDITFDLPYTDNNRYILNYHVYQTNNNSHYLNHNFDGSRDASGSIFADYRNKFEDGILSDNTILYGHNIYTGSMFAKVANYYKSYSHSRDITFYQRHPIVHFNTLYERHDWKIFAVVLLNTREEYGDVFNYNLIYDFNTADEFHDFIFNIMDRSVLFTNVDLTYGDKILTLSTDYFPFGEHVGTRVAVFARRVRDGESIFVDVYKAYFNDNFLPFAHQQRVTGDIWIGRVWDYRTYLLSYYGD
jgi:sortase B